MFRFDNAQLKTIPLDAEYRLLLGERGSAQRAQDALQYETPKNGGCHVNFRAAIVKLVGMKLFGVGLVNALVAAAGAGGDVVATRSCALSAAVCMVASSFYARIWDVRRQGWEGGPHELAMLWPKGTHKGELTTVEHKLFAQENAVDGLRSTDWTITVRNTHPSEPACSNTP